MLEVEPTRQGDRTATETATKPASFRKHSLGGYTIDAGPVVRDRRATVGTLLAKRVALLPVGLHMDTTARMLVIIILC